jgi:hypothetical protein
MRPLEARLPAADILGRKAEAALWSESEAVDFTSDWLGGRHAFRHDLLDDVEVVPACGQLVTHLNAIAERWSGSRSD